MKVLYNIPILFIVWIRTFNGNSFLIIKVERISNTILKDSNFLLLIYKNL